MWGLLDWKDLQAVDLIVSELRSSQKAWHGIEGPTHGNLARPSADEGSKSSDARRRSSFVACYDALWPALP